MESIILKIAAKHLRVILIVLSLIVLYRGHNQPGGGFVGGLIAASSYILYVMAFGINKAMKSLFMTPRKHIGLGLGLGLLSGIPAVFNNAAYMSAQWVNIPLPFNGELKLGTPLLFDVGVYLTVIGVVLTIMFSIMEEK